MEAAIPRIRAVAAAGQTGLLRAAVCASCASSTASSTSSRRNFSVFDRPAPNYPGHVPLTKIERAGLAVGASVMSFFDPYRHGTTVPVPPPSSPFSSLVLSSSRLTSPR
ncbi:ubiquinone biosynthesis protein coq-4, mitochondrial [Ilyonectria robusta]